MRKLILFLSFITLFSCNTDVVFKKNIKDFTDNRWSKNDAKVFEFKIKKDVDAADILLHFSHVLDPQYASVPLEVTIQGPTGENENIFVNLPVKDAEGNSLSDCAGDVCDMEYTLKEDAKLSVGTYKVTVKNEFASDYVPNVLSLGLSVEK